MHSTLISTMASLNKNERAGKKRLITWSGSQTAHTQYKNHFHSPLLRVKINLKWKIRFQYKPPDRINQQTHCSSFLCCIQNTVRWEFLFESSENYHRIRINKGLVFLRDLKLNQFLYRTSMETLVIRINVYPHRVCISS